MKSYRENPEGEENQEATKQSEREVFALKMMNRPKCPKCGHYIPANNNVYDLCDSCEQSNQHIVKDKDES